MSRPSTPTSPESHSNEPGAQVSRTINRREFIEKAVSRFGAIIGTVVLGHEIGGGPLWNLLKDQDAQEDHEPMSEHEAMEALREAELKLEAMLDPAAAEVERKHPELSDREKAIKVIDYLGCGVFAHGVGSLLTGNHIAMLHYVFFVAVMSAKYNLSNEEERHHITEEFQSSAKAGLIIGGTVALAEGIKLDLDKSYETLAGRTASDRDRVALLTMLAGVVSPAITTVGAASVAKNMAQELANGDMDKAAILMQYISNSSGFILFGDPPFIAVTEKYGFEQGVLWQFNTMLPMGIYALLSSAYKINLLRAESEPDAKVVGKYKWALRETKQGFKENADVIVRMAGASLANTLKFYSGVELKWKQNENGLLLELDKALREKMANVVHLFKGEIDPSAHDSHEDGEGLESANEREVGIRDTLLEVVESFTDREVDSSKQMAELEHAMRDQDFEKVEELLREMGIEDGKVIPLMSVSRHMLHKPTPVEAAENDQRPWYNRSLDYMDYLTDLGTLKATLGHNLGDIVDVFPFQAGCVPFLTTAFKDMQDLVSETVDASVEGAAARETMKEACMFLLILMFSSIADNYVACKIGLELFPDKPEVPLIASIIGGGMSSVGNMANLALFNLEQMPLATSYMKDKWHLDIAGVGFVWSQLLSKIQTHPAGKLLFGSAPKVLKAA